MAKYPEIPDRPRRIDELTRPDHPHLCQEDDCYYLWEWDGELFEKSAITDFIDNFKRDMRYKNSSWPMFFKKNAIIHAAKAVSSTILPEWKASTFVPVPPSKIKADPCHDVRLIETLRGITPALQVHEFVIQITNTQSREKHVLPSTRANNWKLVLDSMRGMPKHFVVFDDLLTGGSHFAAMKLVLARKFPNVPVSGLFLARRLLKSIADDPGI